jgi:hypothetical protein
MRGYERKVMDERSYTVRRELVGSECDEGRSAARVSHLLWSDSSWCPLPLQGPRLSRPTSLTTPVQTVSYTLAVHGLMSNHTGTRASNPPTPKRSGKMHQGESLNHLLNFHLPPRQAQPVPRRSRKYGTQHGVWNKERECPAPTIPFVLARGSTAPGFVNAQYRFVMNPMGDYTVHFADPDM